MGLGKLVSQEIEIRQTVSLSIHMHARTRTHTHTHCCCCLVVQSCLTLCNPMHCSLPGFSVHGIFQEEYWSGLPFPSPGDLPNPGIKSMSPELTGKFFITEPPGKPHIYIHTYIHIYIWTMWICYLFKNINNCWQVATLKYIHVSLSCDTSTGYKIWIHNKSLTYDW